MRKICMRGVVTGLGVLVFGELIHWVEMRQGAGAASADFPNKLRVSRDCFLQLESAVSSGRRYVEFDFFQESTCAAFDGEDMSSETVVRVLDGEVVCGGIVTSVDVESGEIVVRPTDAPPSTHVVANPMVAARIMSLGVRVDVVRIGGGLPEIF